VQQGTLPGARLSYDREHRSFLHLEREIFKEHQVRFA
jgi:hypothetical protein